MTRQLDRRQVLQQVATGVGTLFARSGHCLQAAFGGRLDALDDYVERSMARWEVPGLAIAMVKDGRPLIARGYGVRRIEAPEPVDAETVFPIASCTKSFTAAAVARLVDGGQLRWDDAIVRHLPGFQLATPAASQITVRHALSHRTGMPAANMLWRSGAFTSDQILSRLRLVQPVAAPGERFIYNNNLYLVLGRVVEQLSGEKWTDYLRRRLFEPLGMTSTVSAGAHARSLENIAAPHVTEAGKVRSIEPHCPDVIAPAGAIHSNVLDMARWLAMHLETERADRRILSEARLQEMHCAPQTIEAEPGADEEPRAPIGNYGLGWFFNQHQGRTIIEHSGTQNGFVAWVAMLLEERVGVVILANHHRTGINYALRSWLLDAILERPERDWSEIVRNDYATGYQRLLREAQARFDSQHPAPTRPTRPLSEYAGLYESPLYGRIHITAAGGRLRVQFGTRFDGTLEHRQDDAFMARFSTPIHEDWLITFRMNDGRCTGLHAKECPWAPAWYEDADELGEFVRL